MKLEISIESLLNKTHIESDRIEFKAGWNPDDIYHSVCAFANDFNNLGGGYILVGVEQDENGIAIRPVKGVNESELDIIQKNIVGFNNLVSPAYFPEISVETVDDKNVLVMWIPTGIARPYKAPEHITSKKEKKYAYYIRYGTSSIKANAEQEQELIAMANATPFDERPNRTATIQDISPVLLSEHLRETGSKLYEDVKSRGVEAVLTDMHLFSGPTEDRHLKNVALMMFCENPEQFFPYMEVDIVKFPGGSINEPNNFIEVPPIKGPVPSIVKRTMSKLQDMVIEERVTKPENRMESERRYSYPYQALEEAVVNAFYHRDYMSYEPVHIEIEPDHINIISFPGIDRSVSKSTIEEGKRFISRQYRNRRLGEFLKELDLSEGKSTGIPTIQDELRKNGSPSAHFFTDDDRKALRVEIPIHPDFLPIISDKSNSSQNLSQNSSQNETSLANLLLPVLGEKKITKYEALISYLEIHKQITPKKAIEITGMSRATTARYIKDLVDAGVLTSSGNTNNTIYELISK